MFANQRLGFRAQGLSSLAHELLPCTDPSEEDFQQPRLVDTRLDLHCVRDVGHHRGEELQTTVRAAGQRQPGQPILAGLHTRHSKALAVWKLFPDRDRRGRKARKKRLVLFGKAEPGPQEAGANRRDGNAAPT